jgi:signal transduction histidine kinase
VVLLLYAIVVSAIDVSLFRSMLSEADTRVANRLALIIGHPREIRGPAGQGATTAGDGAIYWWIYGLNGQVELAMPGAPPPPAGLHPLKPEAVDFAGHHFRVNGVDALDATTGAPAGWLVVGQSVDDVYRASFNLIVIEIVFGLALGLLTFLGAIWIGRRSVAPVEEARRRQLAFTADASHELRTPLTVIEAEASLALQKDRDAHSYRQSIERIAAESARLRRIVEDLLWLARFESEPSRPEVAVVDVGAVATESVARFKHVADQRSIRLTGSITTLQPPLITAPPEWIDRLAGVLVDNACRYSREQGSVEVSVVTREGRVRLAVDDSGPGIPAEERAHIFDRFHRATDKPGGAGLGLAIGNAVVRATGGQWEVAESPWGGARMAVSWPLTRLTREGELPAPEQWRAPAAPGDDDRSGEEAVASADGDAAQHAPGARVLGDDRGVVRRVDRPARG